MNKSLWFRDTLRAIKPIKDVLLLDFVDDNVHRCYFEYFRRYHTYEEHITPGLELFERVKGLCEEPTLVELAWYYHDLIYVPGSPHSEEISADRAYFDCILFEFGEKIASTVRNLVMATQHFKTEPRTQDEKIIHDLDLAILGSEPDEYEKYEKLIREEYSFVKDKAFAQGRLQVLEQFIKKSGSATDHKKTLYLTQYFQDHYEKKAIDNIRHEMNNIKKSFPVPE